MTSYLYMWDEDVISTALLALLGGFPSGILGIVSYVLTSMALFTMAQRREIRNAWLAWVPVLNCWILGSLSDQYRYVVKGQIRSKRKWLLGLNIANLALGLVMSGFAISLVSSAFRYGDHFEPMIGTILKLAGLALPVAGVAAAITVFRFMALYDVYMSVDPGNAVLFLVLSILIGIVEPFFLFFSRDKDTGMPPRRDAAPTPSQEPWEQENKDYL